MSIHLQIRVVDALLPPQLLERILRPAPPVFQEDQERTMAAVATLIVKLVLETGDSIQKRAIKLLDANPGDKGCQLRAVLLKNFILSPTIADEVVSLKTRISTVQKALQVRCSILGSSKSPQGTAAQFFEHHLYPLMASKEVIYLLSCRLLTVVKTPSHVEANGVIVTKTSIDLLSKLSPKISSIEDRTHFREEIVCNAAVKVSVDSLAFIQQESRKLKVSPLLHRMLSVVRQNKPQGNYKPKSFGCQVSEMQMVLTLLREQEAFIAIKTIVKQGNPQHLFLKPSSPGQEFSPVDIENVPKETLLVVFEGVLGVPIEALTTRVAAIGFSNLILACTAQEEPFEHGSTLEDVHDLEARSEIETLRKLAEEIGCVKGKNPLLLLDHVYCNSLQEELKTQGKRC
jgi:hypothetical protein